MPTTTKISAAAAQRPGWRSGTVFISSGDGSSGTPSITRVWQMRSANVLRSGSHSGRKKPTTLTTSTACASTRRRQVRSVGESPSASSTSEMPARALPNVWPDRRLPYHRLPGVEQRRERQQRDFEHQAADAVQTGREQQSDAIPSPTASNPRSISWA